jgi:anti-sigma factor RsiW
MNCKRALELIDRRIDGELTPAEEHILDFHLMGCPDCRTAFQMTRDLSRMMRSLGHPSVPEGMEQRILARVRADRSRGQSRNSGIRKTFNRAGLALPPIAAALLLVFGVGGRTSRGLSPAGLTHVQPGQVDIAMTDEAAHSSKFETRGVKSRDGDPTIRTYPLLAYSREGRLVSF